MTDLFPMKSLMKSLPDPRTTGFALGYWRPWNEDADLVTSYLDYTKDTSLAKYGADAVGQYVSQASKEHVKAIEMLSNQLSSQLSMIDANLAFLNHNTELAVEQQRLTNVLLQDLGEVLRVPDSEKERQHTIEVAIKFFVNAERDPDLYADALEMLLKAEAMMKQDYFVLHRIGCIYLHVDRFLDPAKALDYFTRAAKYASVEMDPKAARLANILAAGRDAANTQVPESPDAIRSLAAASYEEAAFAAYVIGKNEEAVGLQSKLLKLCPTARARFTLSKYQMRNGKKAEALQGLDQAIADAPLLLPAVFRELDLISEPDTLKVIETHRGTYQAVCDLLQVRGGIARHMLEELIDNLNRNATSHHYYSQSIGLVTVWSKAGTMATLTTKDAIELFKNDCIKLESTIDKLRTLLEERCNLEPSRFEDTAALIVCCLRDLLAYAQEVEATFGRYSREERNRDPRCSFWRGVNACLTSAYVRGCDEGRDTAQEIRHLAEFALKAKGGPFGSSEHTLLRAYSQLVDKARGEEQCAAFVDALTIVAAADGRVGLVERQAIGSVLATNGMAIDDERLKVLVKQAVAELQSNGTTSFANTVLDRLRPHRGTKLLEDVLKAMVDLSERDGAVHDNETRVIKWFKQQLGEEQAQKQRQASAQNGDEERCAAFVDALTLLAAADGRVGSAEMQAIGSVLATNGMAIDDERLKVLVKQAVAELQSNGTTSFANTVLDRLRPHRGTKLVEDVLKAMVDLSERDGAVHDNETRVIKWFKQQLGEVVA